TLQPGLSPNKPGRIETIHFGHLQIHKYNVERRVPFAFRQDFHGLRTVAGDPHDGSRALQKFSRYLLIYLVVLDKENSSASEVGLTKPLSPKPRAAALRPHNSQDFHQGVIEQRWADRLQ